ncbi:MAG: amidohydrolase [Parasporobacterium sp.]|nr:amidohydrolase [Parasporobacterium sp.]
MKYIGIEEHYQPPFLGGVRMEWAQKTERPEMMDMELMIKNVFPRLSSPVEKFRLPEMDAVGLDIQILSSGAPSVQAIDDPVRAVEAARESNDFIAQAVKEHPDRFYGFAALPLADPAAAAEELRRCVLDLGFKGAMIQGHQYFRFLDDQIFDPVWEAAQELKVPLSLHVLDTLPQGMRMFDGMYELCGPIWSWNIEAATHVMRLILSGTFDRFPEVQFIAGHMGEGLPYYMGRMDEGYETGMAHLTKPLKKQRPSEYFRSNIYITTSGKYHPPAMRCAIEAIGADRILFATDYPFVSLKDAFACLNACNLPEEELELICHKNAERLFRL